MILTYGIGHRHGFALMAPWYALIGEKRAWRHDFLKQLARAFDYDLSGKTVVWHSRVDVNMANEECVVARRWIRVVLV